MEHLRTTSRRTAQPGFIMRLLPGFFRLLRILALLLLIGAGIAAWQWFKRQHALPVTIVAIQASYQHIDPKTLQQIINPYLAAGFLHVNLAELQGKLLQLPWIEMVTIKRIWPNKIAIAITERRAVARWGRNALLSAQSVIFKPPVNSFSQGLPLLSGPDDQAKNIWQEYQTMNAALTPLQLQIVELDLTPRHAVSLVLGNGTHILLGYLDVMARFNQLIHFYPKLFVARSGDLESIDLRYPHGMSVRWRNTKS